MRNVTFLLALVVALSAPLFPARAQTTEVVGQDEIEAALDARNAAEEADREAVRRVLETAQARRMAESLGVDHERLMDAAGVVDGERLATAVEYAREIETQLAGGQTISFNATTLIIILLLIIIVVLIAN